MIEKIKNKYSGWFFIFPALILLLIFTIGATLFAVFLSFNKVNMFSGTFEFTGFQNYMRAFADPKLGAAFKNAITFMIIVVPIQTFLALVMAVVLSSKIKFKKTVRMIYFLPTLTSSAALTLIFMFLFNVNGPINEMGMLIGVIQEPINFLQDPSFALKVIMIMNIWSTVPIFMTIYLASLSDIPKSMYEAADLDGASEIQKFFKITIPQVRNVTSYIVMVGIIGTLQMFDQAFIFSNGSGGPENATLTPSLLVYQNAFGTMNSMGYAAALSIILSIFIFLLALFSNKITKASKGVDE